MSEQQIIDLVQPVDEIKSVELKEADLDKVEQYAGISPEMKAKAYEKYLTSGLSIREVAMDLAIPLGAITYWAERERWRDRKDRLTLELYKAAEDRMRMFSAEHQMPTAERHLEMAKSIEGKIILAANKISTEGGNPGDALKMLGRAAKAASEISGVSARAVGLGNTPNGVNQEDGGNNKRRPLVVIGITAERPNVSMR